MEKENALKDWIAMVKKSWTWAKLTEEEKQEYLELLNNRDFKKASYNTRYAIFQCCYDAFLIGLGYKPIGWREENV